MPTDATALAAVAAGVALLSLALVVLLAVRLGRLERAAAARAALPWAGPDDRALAQLQADLATALRHVAVVRYDAFPDLGGRMSFSAALLDDGGDGLVLSSIAGRSETRTYAKGVVSGGSEHPLSPEEREALARALGSRTPRPRPAASPSRVRTGSRA